MRRTFLIAPLLAAFIVGCGKDSPATADVKGGGSTKGSNLNVAGKWKVDPDFQKANENIKPAGFMTGFSSTFWYDLKADNTFEGAMSSGTYKVSGDSITISTTKVMGQDVGTLNNNKEVKSVEMKGEFSNNGKTLTLHPPSSGLMPAELNAGIKMAKE